MTRLPLFAAAVSLCCLVHSAWAQPAPRAQVIVTEIDGIIQPITAEYFIDAIDAADTSGAELVVLVLRTPGGLLDSTRSMVSRMITSRAPVVVFVGPSGARGICWIRSADRRRRCGNGAGHACRRGTPGVGLGREDGRHHFSESGVGRGRVRAIAGRGTRT